MSNEPNDYFSLAASLMRTQEPDTNAYFDGGREDVDADFECDEDEDNSPGHEPCDEVFDAEFE